MALRASSICGTDIHIWEWNEWARGRLTHLPMVFGHELAGEVVELGPGVTSLAVGDRVSAETHLADGTCYQCRQGKMHVCAHVQVLGVDRDGIFAEYAVLPAANAWRNDPGLDPAIASIQEPLGNAVHSLLPEDGVEEIAGRDVLVTGAGPIGLLAIAVARLLGARRVLASEVNPTRIALAKRMGADRVIDPREGVGPAARAVLEETDGRGVDVAVEMSGHPSGLALAFEALTSGGRVSLLGLPDGPSTIDLNSAVIFRAARVYGIFGRRMFGTWYQVRGLLARPELREKMGEIITHRMPIGDLPKAMELLKSGAAAKISLAPRF